eukprot:NODE_283_length_10814_cov_0.705460.p5 type:complete len:288 gc:universal NODE_283_length_10814_cov_0.705460:2688-3551(+)
MDETRDSLLKIVEKTPINDKLLSRPPFRYLYDVITEINTKYTILTLPTIDIENISKEQKVLFLESVIEQLGSIAKPSKIVAGLEVEETWEMLRLLSNKAESKKLAAETTKKLELKKSQEPKIKTTLDGSRSKSKDPDLKRSNSKENSKVKDSTSPYTKPPKKSGDIDNSASPKSRRKNSDSEKAGNQKIIEKGNSPKSPRKNSSKEIASIENSKQKKSVSKDSDDNTIQQAKISKKKVGDVINSDDKLFPVISKEKPNDFFPSDLLPKKNSFDNLQGKNFAFIDTNS